MNLRNATITLVGILSMAHAVNAFEVELKVTETAGVTRVGAPCHSGVPLPPGAVADEGKLRLLDAAGKPTPAQFRVLSRRQTGDIAWVAVSFLTDVRANGTVTYRLTDIGGTAPVGKPLKITEDGESVTVVTGPLRAVLAKTAFGGLGEVWLDRNGDGAFAPDEKAATGGALVVEGMDGRTYRSIKDLSGPVRVSFEERGPIRAVVRIDGKIKAQSADGKSHSHPHREFSRGKMNQNPDVVLQNTDASLGFTVRLHFWQGSSQVRAFVTISNLKGISHTRRDMKIRYGDYYAEAIRKGGNVLVDGIELELDLPQAERVDYRIGGGNDGDQTHEGQLAGADSGVTLYQESAASWLWQAGSGKIFDPRLKKNKEFMATLEGKNKGKAYFEYSDLWYNQLNQLRDGLTIMGYRLYPTANAITPGSASSHAGLGKAAGEGMRAPGWLELDDGKTAVTVGCRWFWQMSPKHLRARPGRISIGLWSQLVDRGHLFEGKLHKTHELMFDFRASKTTPAAAQRFAAFDDTLLAVPNAKYLLASRAYGDFMLLNPKEWPKFERSALTAVVCGVDPALNPGHDSSFEIEREKYDHYGVWRFGDHAKGGYHHFSQYLELDVPYCLMVHFARTGDLRFYREAEIACRQLLDVPAHGGGHGHQKGEASHFYTTGPLLYAFTAGEQWLLDSVLTSYKVANTSPWHLRSFGVTMWSSLDIYAHFPSARQLARGKIDGCLTWWKGVQNKDTGHLGGFDRKRQTFFLGLGADAMGRYCETFPDDRDARDRLVSACREWINWIGAADDNTRRQALSPTPANGLAYASRFSGDESFIDFAAKRLVRDGGFLSNFRNGITSGKSWSEHAHRLTQVFLHDLDKKRHPERYKQLLQRTAGKQ